MLAARNSSLALVAVLGTVPALAEDGGAPPPAPAAVEWVRSPYPQVPVSVKLELARDAALVPGLFADHVFVVVRNHTEDVAVAIRSVRWWEGGRPRQP
jgi:hypothetical protein